MTVRFSGGKTCLYVLNEILVGNFCGRRAQTSRLLVGWQLQSQPCCYFLLTASAMLAKCRPHSINKADTVTISEHLYLFIPYAQISEDKAPLSKTTHG